MIVVTRHSVSSDPEATAEFQQQARTVLEAFAECAGYQRGTLARCADDPQLWTIVTEWAGPGYYRRALSAFSVRMVAVPLLSEAWDEPSAFEKWVEVPSAS
ncbi:antibiotic biosynthesis monooxygenase [Lipingzhangella sp. LS1_29]|uniref:Antibiotic biosynthesis monooxygenase n=1 Tax=Lipingzhangella rawalii TaxID=2055835 RepID=A0ABU2H7B3_9ACTN|nr:antibiotic biosynthesis monooxygenase [Lipingzhangella rawalii]MDS1271214.1 antibiotic biosynthesis monooxygenase [Lipingzhangella rawalii]